MEFSILNFFGATLVPGIVTNASWDAIKEINLTILNYHNSYENLLFSAFIEAVRIHDKQYDETAKLVTKTILKKCKNDKEGCIKIFTRNVSDDYVAYLNCIKTGEFQDGILDDLVSFFKKDNKVIFPELLRPILEDTLKIYTVTAWEQLKKHKKDDIQFLQLLKIDAAIDGIEKLSHKLENLEQAVECLKEKIIENQAIVIGDAELHRVVEKCSEELFISIIYILEDHGLEILYKDIDNFFALFETVNSFFSHRMGLYYVDDIEKINKIVVEISTKNISREFEEFIVVADSSQAFEGLENVFGTAKNVLLITTKEFFQRYDGLLNYISGIEAKYGSIERIYYPCSCYENSINEAFDSRDYLKEIIEDGGRILLLGDYGFGKTFLCEYFACFFSKRIQEIGLIPVYINLENKNANVSIEEFINWEIIKTGIHIKNKEERLILFIDGFELMDLQYNVIDIERNIREISNICVKRIVVTSRRIFFKNDSQIKRFYGFHIITLKYRTVDERMSFYERSAPQVKIGLENLENKYTKNALLELSNTPAFADILMQCIKVRQNRNIYEILCELINICNVTQDKRFYLLAEDEECLLSAIAAKIYCKSVNWLSTLELKQIIFEYANSRYTSLTEIEHDIRNSPFLIRTADNRWLFSQGVFLEYFTAVTIQKEIVDWSKGKSSLSVFSMRKLPMGILNILSDMKISNFILEQIIYFTRNKDINIVGYIGANAVSLLNFRHGYLKNKDFSNTVLVDSDFRSADLTGCQFRGANLYTANFDNCILDDCDFSDANLLYASMKECKGILDIVYLNENEVICSNLNAEIISIDLVTKQVRCRYDGHINNSRILLRWNDYIISGGKDFKIIVWERTGSIVKSFSGHSDGIWDLDILQENGLIVSGSSDKTVRVWQLNSEDKSVVLEGHDDEVRSVLFIDKSYIVSGGLDRRIILWNYVEEYKEDVIVCENGITSIVYNRESKRLFVGDEVGGLYIFKIDADEKKLEMLVRVQATDCMIRAMECLNKNRIVLGCEDGEVLIVNDTFDTDELFRNLVWKHDGAVNKVHVINDKILSVSYDNVLHVENSEHHLCIDLSDILYAHLKHKFSCNNMVISDKVHFSQSKMNYLMKRGAYKASDGKVNF